MQSEKDLLDTAWKRVLKLYNDGDGELSENNFKIIQRFHRQRKNSGLKERTLINDITAICEFVKIIKKPIDELTEDDIYDFFDKLDGKTIGTINNYKLRLAVFFRFAKREDLAQICKIKNSQSNRKLPEHLLNHEDIEKLIDATQNLRDAAYIAVLYESGARKGELHELKIKNIEFDENGTVITMPKGKTGARRIRLIFASSYLRNWLSHHPGRDSPESYVWVSSTDGKTLMTVENVWYTLRRAAKNAGIDKKVNPHAFRHARATHLAKDLTEQQLKAYLGWTPDSLMAGIYVHLSGKDLDKAILKLNGLKVEEEPEDNALKTTRCPRCKEIQDKKASFCFKCGLPLNKEFAEKIDADFQKASAKTIDFNDPDVKDQLLKFLTGTS